jgi:hypothetical protein
LYQLQIMTITTIYNAVALGTTSEASNGSPTKTVLQAGTTAVILNAKLTNGDNTNKSTGIPGQSTMLDVRYAIAPFALTADTSLPSLLKNSAGKLELHVDRSSGGVTIDNTGLIANNGGNLYTWFNSPALSAGATITLTSVELP